MGIKNTIAWTCDVCGKDVSYVKQPERYVETPLGWYECRVENLVVIPIGWRFVQVGRNVMVICSGCGEKQDARVMALGLSSILGEQGLRPEFVEQLREQSARVAAGDKGTPLDEVLKESGDAL